MATKNNKGFCWPDARGWIGVGIYSLTLVILLMIWKDRSLRNDEFFQAVAVLIIGTGFVNGVVSWAFSATQGGGELAARNADVVENTIKSAVAPMAGKNETPQDVRVINEPQEPVPTDPAAPKEELPDYAR